MNTPDPFNLNRFLGTLDALKLNIPMLVEFNKSATFAYLNS